MTSGGESFSQWRWRWILLAAGTVLILLAVIFLIRRSHEPVRTARAGGPGTAQSHDIVSSRLQEPAPPAQGGFASGASQRPVTVAGITDNLCGVNASDQTRGDGETLDQHVARVTDGAIGHWQKILVESGDPRRRAVGLALGNAKPRPEFGPYAPPDTQSNNNVVLLALESNDPAIYAFALGQCGDDNLDMGAGPCQGLSLEHWAQIDADNATPWIWMASRAVKAGDDARTDEALDRAANALYLQSYAGAMSAAALDVLPHEVTPLEKAVAGADLVSISRMGIPFALFTSLCSEEALHTVRRRSQCSSIAELLADQGSTIIEVSIAAILAQRLGWPEDRWMLLRKESDSDRRALSHPWGQADSSEGFRCETVQRYDFFVEQLEARGSERAAMKAAVEAR